MEDVWCGVEGMCGVVWKECVVVCGVEGMWGGVWKEMCGVERNVEGNAWCGVERCVVWCGKKCVVWCGKKCVDDDELMLNVLRCQLTY